MGWNAIRKLSAAELDAVEPDAKSILADGYDRKFPDISAWGEIENLLQNWGGLSQVERGEKEYLAREWAAALQKRYGDPRAERIEMDSYTLVLWDGPLEYKW